MLTAYQTAVQNLIQAPSAPNSLVPAATLTANINTARAQVALDAECIRQTMTLALAGAQQSYPFSAFSGAATGVQTAPLAVRQALFGSAEITVRNWEWFFSYCLTASAAGTPNVCAQQGRGQGGTLWFWPTPNATLTGAFDVVGLPIPLVDDSTAEAIPYPWTDAVPFYAAWLTLMSQQRQPDAQLMLQRYQLLIRRGTDGATGSFLPDRMPGGAGAIIASTHQGVAQPPPSGRR